MDASTSLVGTQVGSTLLAVGGMQYLKNAKWFKFLQPGQKSVNRIVSVLVAGGIAIGIHVTFTGSASQGWSGTFSIPSVWTMLVAAFHWASQYIYQETGYSILGGLQSLSSLAENLKSVIPQAAFEAHPEPGEAAVKVIPVKS